MSLAKETLTLIIRHALGILFGWLVIPAIAHGWLNTTIGDRITGDLNGWASITAATIIGLGAPLLWSFANKVEAKVKVIIAQHLPVTSTLATVQAHADAMPLPEKISLAVNGPTVPTSA